MSSHIRLLWVIDRLGSGGAEGLALPFLRGLDRSRYELSVVSLAPYEGAGIGDGLRELGVEPSYLGAHSLRDVRTFRRFLALIRHQRIDLIHAHLTYAGIWSTLASRITGVPAVVSLHVAPFATRQQHRGIAYRLLTDARDWLMRHALGRWASRVVMVSSALRDTYLALPGLDRSRVDVVHNGIDVERFAHDRRECRTRLEREFAIPRGATAIVTVAVLRPAKGIEVLLEAARQINDAVFVIIGDGPSRAALTELAASLGVSERVRWAGFRPDVDALLAGFDLFAHPTLDDAFPTVLLEAQAAGLPVVASRVGGVPEIVTSGETGLLVPAGDANGLASGIRELSDAPDRVEAMRRAAAANVARRFSLAAWIARLADLYESALYESAQRKHGGRS